MLIQTARHDIQDGLYIYRQENSSRWYARFVLYGKWYSKATKEKELGNAVARAHLILMEYKVKAENNLLVDSKRFKDVADRVIKSLQNELDNGGGKVTYRDYIQALNKYHIPYFDRTYITSIDQESINAFNKWRIEKFKRIPAKSTLLTHNSAMNLVFIEAIEYKWMIAAQVPVLHTKGEISYIFLLSVATLLTLNIIVSNEQLVLAKKVGLAVLFLFTNALLLKQIMNAIHGKTNDKLMNSDDRENKRRQNVQRGYIGIAASICILHFLAWQA